MPTMSPRAGKQGRARPARSGSKARITSLPTATLCISGSRIRRLRSAVQANRSSPDVMQSECHIECRMDLSLRFPQRWRLGLPLRPQHAHEIALAQGHALHPQNVVSGRGMKIEVRQREGEQKILGREVPLRVARFLNDFSAFAGVDLVRRHMLQLLARFCDKRLQLGIILLWPLARPAHFAVFDRLDRADRKDKDVLNLEAKRMHVRKNARFDQFFRIDAVLAAMREAFAEKAVDCAEGLQKSSDTCIIERNRHYLPSARARIAARCSLF